MSLIHRFALRVKEGEAQGNFNIFTGGEEHDRLADSKPGSKTNFSETCFFGLRMLGDLK
jgi:hypothetical protein